MVRRNLLYIYILEFQGATPPLFLACWLAFLARTQGLATLASHAAHARARFTYSINNLPYFILQMHV